MENHDLERAAARFVTAARLRAWTLTMFFLPGIGMAYMGQESALERRPSLFDKDPLDWAAGNEEFRLWFGALMKGLKGIKGRAPFFSYRELARGVYSLERRILPDDARPKYLALVNLEGWNRPVGLPEPLAGKELLSGDSVELGKEPLLFEEPVIVEL